MDWLLYTFRICSRRHRRPDRRRRRLADDPLLVLLFGIHPATAVGTDLLYAALTKSGGTVVHGRRHIDWKIVRLLASAASRQPH